MQKFLRLSLLVAITLSCSWHARDAHSAGATAKLPLEIPIKIDGGMPTIELMVNGKGPFVFGIDTGAQGGARIDSSLMEKLALKSTGQLRATDGSGRNPQMAERVTLESIEIGGLRFTDVTAGSRNYRKSPRPLDIDGILGLSVFSEYLVTLDYPAKLLRIEKGELPKADGAEILDYKSKDGIPLLEMSVGSTKIDAHLDSGNMVGAFVLPTAFAEKLTRASEAVVVGRARSASGEMEIKQVQVKDVIRLGRHEFPEPTITFPALSDIGNVGAKTLSQFVVTFDQKNERVRLTRR
ncbi:MAG TPA: retropepsin-like aspartic protease [Chthoniobacterales bacterium]|nr:retropepsin-like aspartic protease [Chthoniobacterales bacterium]